MKPKGWRKESRRHSLARKGIATKTIKANGSAIGGIVPIIMNPPPIVSTKEILETIDNFKNKTAKKEVIKRMTYFGLPDKSRYRKDLGVTWNFEFTDSLGFKWYRMSIYDTPNNFMLYTVKFKLKRLSDKDLNNFINKIEEVGIKSYFLNRKFITGSEIIISIEGNSRNEISKKRLEIDAIIKQKQEKQ